MSFAPISISFIVRVFFKVVDENNWMEVRQIWSPGERGGPLGLLCGALCCAGSPTYFKRQKISFLFYIDVFKTVTGEMVPASRWRYCAVKAWQPASCGSPLNIWSKRPIKSFAVRRGLGYTQKVPLWQCWLLVFVWRDVWIPILRRGRPLRVYERFSSNAVCACGDLKWTKSFVCHFSKIFSE